LNFKPQREAYLEEERLWVEAAGGSDVVSSPDPESRGCEMAARFERETDGERVEFCRETEREGVGFLFLENLGKKGITFSTVACKILESRNFINLIFI